MKPNRPPRPIVVFAPDPPDLTRPRLLLQFAAGFTLGVVLILLAVPLMPSVLPRCATAAQVR